MKPRVVKAYACAACHRTYQHDADGKRFATECCRCTKCKTGVAAYMGGAPGRLCEECFRVADLKAAEECLVHTQERVDKARAAVEQERPHSRGRGRR